MSPNFDKDSGLVPAIVQDNQTQDVLMLAYMNADSFQKSIDTKKLTFFSRSRNSLWVKGETSGNFLELVSWKLDCDRDTLLFQARPVGPSCHLGTRTCFGDESHNDLGFLKKLEEVISQRISDPNNTQSYVATLMSAGLDRIAQKVGEEAVETVIASKNNDVESFENEAADLLFHLLLLLKAKNSSLGKLATLLQERHKK